jgi:hypothetical protein
MFKRKPIELSPIQSELFQMRLDMNKSIGILEILNITDYNIDNKIAEEIYDLTINLSKFPIKINFFFERPFNLDDLKEVLIDYKGILTEEQFSKLFNALKDRVIK